MIVIPAIDLMDGKCVRLSQGEFDRQKIYSENPLEVALSFEASGLSHIHVVDLDGAKQGNMKHWKIIDAIATKTKLKVDFGGGIKTEEEIVRLLDMGVSQINLGSIAYKEPEKVKSWILKFGSEKIILSADSNNEMLAVAGWQNQTKVPLLDFIMDFVSSGLQFATCTDIAKDGMMAGANIALYKKILAAIPMLKLIASGGVNSMEDLESLSNAGCHGSIVGKAIYEGSFTLESLSKKFHSPLPSSKNAVPSGRKD